MRTYYYSIDFIKFFCAIAVVLIHSTTYLSLNGLATFSNYYVYRYFLDIAVPFFFIVSGFFFGQKLLVKHEPILIIKYIQKILSYYIIFTLFYLAAKVLFSVGEVLFLNLSINAAMINFGKSLSYINILNGSIGSFHLWFLASLIYACLMLYAMVRFHSNAYVVLGSATFLYFFFSSNVWNIPSLFNHGSIIIGFIYLSIGYFTAQFENIDKVKYPLFFSVVFGFLYFVAAYKQISLSGLFLCIWAFYIVVTCVKSPNFGKGRLITSLSKYALAIYILHIFVRDIIIEIYKFIGFDDFYTWLPHYFITVAACIIVPIFIFNPIYNGIQFLWNALFYTTKTR